MSGIKYIPGNGIIQIKILAILICMFLIFLSYPAFGEMDNNHKQIVRSARQPNTDHSGNDDFSTASVVQYDPSGTTHITIASVGGTDQRDFWRLDADRGTHEYKNNKVISSLDPVHLVIMLSFNETNQGSNGVFMNIYDAEYHKLGTSSVATEGNPNILDLITQVNSYLYLEIRSNPASSSYKYILDIVDDTVSKNPAYRNDEKFSTAKEVNITAGKTLNNNEDQYLDKGYDFADFYKFNVSKDQKIEVDLTINNLINEDFDLFLYDGPSFDNLVRSSERKGQNENIEYYSPIDGVNTYYLRVGVKNIADPIRNKGTYTLTLKGNIPPQWNTSFPDKYVMFEDGYNLILDIPSAYFELNAGDHIFIETWDPDIGSQGDWTDSFTSISLENVTVNYRNIDKSYKVKPKANKFGTEIISVRATDDLSENYTYKDIKIILKPTNDPPVLNGTNHWIITGGLTPSNDGYQITGREGQKFECSVTSYEPYDPWDSVTFSDNTDLFDIDPDTGKILFTATYNYTGKHKIEITAHDNGTPQLNTTREFKIIIDPSDVYPEVELVGPPRNSIQSSLYPQFAWRQINEEFFDLTIYYDFYLSTKKSKIEERDKSALISTFKDTTVHVPKTNLSDKTKYYWTVIPNDGLHLGKCISGIYSFETNTKIEIPRVNLLLPYNNQIVDTDIVTLSWDLEYSGLDKVSYDVYFGVSLGELQDPLVEPRATVNKKSYVVKNLYYDRNYYWKVVPFTDTLRANESMTEIFSFYLEKNIPRIDLISPNNNSIILPKDNIVLTWDINYTKPGKISCTLFWGTSLDFVEEDGISMGNNRSYVLSSLAKDSYYWKVVPYLEGLRGTESKTWMFTIKEVAVPKAVIETPLNTTLYSTGKSIVVVLEWSVEYEGVFNPQDVWFDVYLDNSTKVEGEMTKITVENYQQTFFTVILPFEQYKVYNWYVIPHLRTDEGSLTGICSQGVVSFDLGEPEKQYLISLTLSSSSISIEPGTNKILYFIIKNLGNQKSTVDITVITDNEEFIKPTLPVQTTILDIGSNNNMTLNVLVLANAKYGNFNITVKAVVRESTYVTAQRTLSLSVEKEDKNGDNGDNKKGSEEPEGMFGLGKVGGIDGASLLIIVIIIVIILLFALLMRKKPEEELEEKDLERAPSPVPTHEPRYGAEPFTSPTQAPQVKVSPIQPAKPSAQVKPVTPLPTLPPAGKIEPIAKPVTAKPAKPTPAKSKPVSAKPITALPVAAKPVAAKPIKTPPQVQPAKPIQTPMQTAPAQAVPAKKQIKPVKPQEEKK